MRTPVWRKTARQRDLCEKTANRPLLMTGPFGKYSEKNKSPGRRSEDGKRAANIAGARIQRLGKQQRSLIGETDDKSSKNEKPRFLPQTEGMQEGEKERFSCEKQYTIMALGRWDVGTSGLPAHSPFLFPMRRIIRPDSGMCTFIVIPCGPKPEASGGGASHPACREDPASPSAAGARQHVEE